MTWKSRSVLFKRLVPSAHRVCLRPPEQSSAAGGRDRGWSPRCRAPAASSQGAARSGWTDTSADTAAHAGGRKGRLNCLYSSAASTLTECLGPRIHAQPPVLSGLLTIPHARSEAPWVSGGNDFADTRPKCSSVGLPRLSWWAHCCSPFPSQRRTHGSVCWTRCSREGVLDVRARGDPGVDPAGWARDHHALDCPVPGLRPAGVPIDTRHGREQLPGAA